MSRILISGINGQDGSYLAELLLSLGHEVFGMVRHSANPNYWRLSHILDKITLLESDLLDLTSLMKVIRTVQPREVYHLAAQSFVKASFDQAILTTETNAVGTLKLLEAIKEVDPTIRFYNAATSELFGLVQEIPQRETTLFHPRSPYGVSKAFAYYITMNYREAYNIHASSGILYNHESSRRGLEFVTRKITDATARIKLKKQKELFLGNLDAKRDWGHSKDFVRAMYLMLQQDTPDDYIIATGEMHSVRDFCEVAFDRLKLDYKKYVKIDPKFFRPSEVDLLIGDYSKAKNKLGWEPSISFEDLVIEMVDADLERVKKELKG